MPVFDFNNTPEPEGRTSSVTGGMQISIRGQDSKLSRDPTLKGNEVCIRL